MDADGLGNGHILEDASLALDPEAAEKIGPGTITGLPQPKDKPEQPRQFIYQPVSCPIKEARETG